MVVIRPRTIPNFSCSTLAKGTRQLVVQEALETTWWFLGSYLSSFTPITMVMSSFLAGAEMITFLAPPFIWATAFSLSVNLPVDSTTYSTPRLDQGMREGSFSAKTLTSFPLILMEFSLALTSAARLPRTESYFKRWANVLASVKSLAATISIFLLFIAAR